MELKEYSNLFKRQEKNFWHVGRREILSEAINKFCVQKNNLRILDIGCGAGGNFSLLGNFGLVTGVDFSSEALKFASNFRFEKLIQSDAAKMALDSGYYDLAAALDVLEHIDDDVATINEVYRVLKPNGIFLVTVPAYKFLWSEHDEALHHVRRYAKKEILSKLKEAGFLVLENNRFVMLGVIERILNKIKFFLLANKHTAKNKQSYDIDPPSWVNYILLLFMRFEKFLMRRVRLPFGTSILAIAKKPDNYDKIQE